LVPVILAGGDAYRQAELSAKVRALAVQLATTQDLNAKLAILQHIEALKELTQIEWANADAQQALTLKSPAWVYQQEQEKLAKLVEILKASQGGMLDYGEAVNIASQKQDDFNKLTEKTIDGLLRFGGAREGVTAFFLKMQEDAKTAAAIVYESLSSAFDKLSDQLTKLLTGQKTSWAKTFKELGTSMVHSVIQTGLQKAVGAIGKKMGIDIGKADGSKSNPFYVVPVGGTGLTGKPTGEQIGGKTPGQQIGGKEQIGTLDRTVQGQPGPGGTNNGWPTGGGGSDSTGGTSGTNSGWPSGGDGTNNSTAATANAATGILGQLGSSIGGTFGKVAGAISGIMSKIGPILKAFGAFGGGFADGGDLTNPSAAYLVGEKGPEILSGVSGHIMSNTQSHRMLGQSAGDVHYSIDARGTDAALVEARVRRSLQQVHGSAIQGGFKATQDHKDRTPQKTRK
jgi:hypothetical protein